MAAVARFSPGNRLLQSLSSSDIELLAPHLMTVVLRVPQDVERPNKTIRDIYFPDTGVVSVVAINADGTQVEVGVIGSEGMSGIAVILGNEQSPHATYVQIAGRGMRIAVADLRDAMRASGSLRALLLRYVQTFMVQTAHTAIATHDPAIVATARARIAAAGVPPERYEFQMLYGIALPLQREIVAAGYPLRIAAPYGPTWFTYLMRRLAERPANLGFFLRNAFRR